MDFFGDNDSYDEYDWMYDFTKRTQGGHQILPSNSFQRSVWISNLSFASNPKKLDSCKLTAVLSACMPPQPLQLPPSTPHLILPLLDIQTENIAKHFSASFNFIQQQRKTHNVLVHCAAGISRSVTLVVAYMMKKYGMGFQHAIAEVRKKRSIAEPNRGFQKQLRIYEKLLKGNPEGGEQELEGQSEKVEEQEDKYGMVEGLPYREEVEWSDLS